LIINIEKEEKIGCFGSVAGSTTATAEADGRAQGRIGSRSSPVVESPT
jgi:hypothetical protein